MSTTKVTATKVTTTKAAAPKATAPKAAAPKATATKAAAPKAAAPVVTNPEPKAQRNDTLRNVFFGLLSILVIVAIVFFALQIKNQAVQAAGNKPVVNEPVVNEPVVNEPVVNEPVVNEPKAKNPSEVIMDYGAFGAYKSEYDSNLGKYVVGFWEGSRTRQGKTLADMKTESSSVSFVLPFDAEINNSAGEIFVDGIEWKLGNPIQDQSGNTIIPAGSSISISYESDNDSAGWMIIFQ